MRQLARAAYQLRIDIDRRDIIDNDGHAQAGAVRENMIEQCGLAGAKKAAEYGDREGAEVIVTFYACRRRRLCRLAQRCASRFHLFRIAMICLAYLSRSAGVSEW